MPQILVQIAIAVVLGVISYFLMPKPSLRTGSQREQDVDITGSAEGVPLEVGFGTYEIKGTYVWPRAKDYCQRNKVNHDDGSYDWYISWATAFGAGVDKIHAIRWEDCTVYSSPVTYDAITHPDGYATLSTTKGTVRFYFGKDNRVADPHITAVVTAKEAADNKRIPILRHTAYAVFEQNKTGLNNRIPQITFKLTRVPQCPIDETLAAGLSATYRMSSTEANPVHVLAEIATNTEWGGGIPLDKIDWASWNDVAEICASENRYVSGKLDQLQSFDEIASQLLYHMDAFLIRRDGQYVLSAPRQNYSLSNVTVVARNDISDAEIIPCDMTQVINFLSVEYTDAGKDYITASFPLTDAGHALIVDNTRRETLKLPLFTSAARARSIAATKAQELLTAHDVLTITVARRAAYDIEVGDLRAFDYAPALISSSTIWRIVEVKRAARGQKYAVIKAIEELGYLTHTLTQPEGGGVNGGSGGIGGVWAPAWTTNPLNFQLPLELPYPFNTAGTTKIAYLANREDGALDTMRLFADTGSGFVQVATGLPFQFAGNATIIKSLEIDDTGFVVSGPNFSFDWENLLNTAPLITRDDVLARSRLAVLVSSADPWQHEIVAFQSVELESADPITYRISGVVRALYDTKQISGAMNIFIVSAATFSSIGPRADWLNGVVATFKAQPYSGDYYADIDDMDTRSLTFKSRALRPYAVQSLALDGNGSNPAYTGGVSARLSWLPVNRIENGSYNDVATTPESGEDYVVRYGATEVAVPASQSFVDGWGVTRIYTDITIPASTGDVAVTVHARRGALESLDNLCVPQLVLKET